MNSPVHMTHRETKGTAEFPEKAVSGWEAKGWERTTPETLAKTHSRDELDDLAGDAGVDPSDFATKADLAEAILDD